MNTARNRQVGPRKKRVATKPPKRDPRYTNIAARRTSTGWRWRANWCHDGVREWGPLRETQTDAFQDFLDMRERGARLPVKIRTLEEAAVRLIEVTKQAGRSPRTVRYYDGRCKLFKQAWLPETLLSDIDVAEVEWFIDVRRKTHKVGNNTVHHDLAVLHRLFEVCGVDNPVKQVDGPTLQEGKRDFFPVSEIEEIIRRVRASDDCRAAQHHADLMELLAWTGMRSTELARVTKAHVELENNRIWVQGKNKPRELPINHIRSVLERLVGALEKPNSKLVPGGVYYISTMFQRWQDRLNIPKLNARTLRHSFATALFDRGNPPHVVQTLMGHLRLTTTQKYLHVRDGALRNALDGLRQS